MNEWERASRQSADLSAVRRAFSSEWAANEWLHQHSPRLGDQPMRLLLNGQGHVVVREARRAAA